MTINIKQYIIEGTQVLQFAQDELSKKFDMLNQSGSDANTYDIEKHKDDVKKEIKENPEVAKEIKLSIQDEELNESVIAKLKDYKIAGSNFVPTSPGEGSKHITGNGSTLSKSGLSNTEMGTNQVQKHQRDVASGINKESLNESTDSWSGGKTSRYKKDIEAEEKRKHSINKAAKQANDNAPSTLLKTEPTHHRKPGHDVLHQISLNKG
jgi:hypothetical protein